jgi:hypothetical protein
MAKISLLALTSYPLLWVFLSLLYFGGWVLFWGEEI